ncbi:uncharacterized protein LOC144577184 [Callithrix jacchus]
MITLFLSTLSSLKKNSFTGAFGVAGTPAPATCLLPEVTQNAVPSGTGKPASAAGTQGLDPAPLPSSPPASPPQFSPLVTLRGLLSFLSQVHASRPSFTPHVHSSCSLLLFPFRFTPPVPSSNSFLSSLLHIPPHYSSRSPLGFTPKIFPQVYPSRSPFPFPPPGSPSSSPPPRSSFPLKFILSSPQALPTARSPLTFPLRFPAPLLPSSPFSHPRSKHRHRSSVSDPGGKAVAAASRSGSPGRAPQAHSVRGRGAASSAARAPLTAAAPRQSPVLPGPYRKPGASLLPSEGTGDGRSLEGRVGRGSRVGEELGRLPGMGRRPAGGADPGHLGRGRLLSRLAENILPPAALATVPG